MTWLAIAFTAAFVAPTAADQWEKTYDIAGQPELVLRVDDAHVHFTTWDRKEVRLHVVTRGWTIGPRGLRITARQNGDRLECEVREPRMHWRFGWTPRWVRMEVSLPRDADVDITTGDGDVELGPLSGELRVRTGDGSIRAHGLRGDLLLRSGDGRIRALDTDGALQATTSDGSMEIEGRFDQLRLDTGDGRIRAVAVEGSRIASDWELSTGDGSLSLKIPRDLRADVYLRTGDGRIDLRLPIEVSGQIRRHAVSGRLNGGGARLEMRSGDGSIVLGGL
jgi:hypothetical protein